MPITKSAKKAYVSSERKRAHNLVWEKKLKFALKKVNKDNVNDTISVIDKTAKRHIISKNKAARLKSRIAKKFGTAKIMQKSKIKSQNDPTPLKLRGASNVKLKKGKVTEKQKTAKKPAPKPSSKK